MRLDSNRIERLNNRPCMRTSEPSQGGEFDDLGACGGYILWLIDDDDSAGRPADAREAFSNHSVLIVVEAPVIDDDRDDGCGVIGRVVAQSCHQRGNLRVDGGDEPQL